MATDTVVAHPLSAPVVSGNDISVDEHLQNPTRITRMISELSYEQFIAEEIFASAGGVSGGAVIFDVASTNELYATRDVKRIAPGQEFPLIATDRLAPQTAEVEKWGGKTFITDEAKDRNAQALFTNEVRRLTNTIIRKVDQKAMSVLADAVTTYNRTVVGQDWSAVVTTGSSASSAQEWPAADFAAADLAAENLEIGVKYDTVLVNPQEMASLIVTYGEGLNSLLTRLGKRVRSSVAVPAGTAYFLASKQVGEMRIEKPLSTETWREQKTERTWVQSGVRPVMYITNPYNVLKMTGLAG